MIKTLEYHKKGYTPCVYNDFEAFIQNVQRSLQIEDVVRCVLEPGDATRYEILLMLFDEGQIIMVAPIQGWAGMFGTHVYVTPDMIGQMNTCTQHLIAELHAQVIGYDTFEYFDFEIGRARCDMLYRKGSDAST